jgi:hypothetical protein
MSPPLPPVKDVRASATDDQVAASLFDQYVGSAAPHQNVVAQAACPRQLKRMAS